MSATTVYWLKVDVPMKWSSSLPLQVKREVPSGITPLPCVARILPQRLVLPDLQNLHSLHSGVLGVLASWFRRRGRRESLLECYDVVAGLDGGDPRADGLDDTGSLVTEDDGESTLGVLSGQSVGIYLVSVRCFLLPKHSRNRTCVADSSVVDLNADFVGLGWSNLNVLDSERLSSFPCHSSLSRR